MKHCTVSCDTPTGVLECELDLPDDATIDAAITAARGRLGEDRADWECAATGVFGRVQPRSHVPLDGDRIELYRPLTIDPRASRRLRAQLGADKRS
ncbi:MAG TPA: RnfH family protein [Steroidobacteraceae bacterium]|jgi:hypothetical protein